MRNDLSSCTKFCCTPGTLKRSWYQMSLSLLSLQLPDTSQYWDLLCHQPYIYCIETHHFLNFYHPGSRLVTCTICRRTFSGIPSFCFHNRHQILWLWMQLMKGGDGIFLKLPHITRTRNIMVIKASLQQQYSSGLRITRCLSQNRTTWTIRSSMLDHLLLEH